MANLANPDIAPMLQLAISNSTGFSSIATDAGGLIQLFNAGAERMLGYAAAIAPGIDALVFKASRGIEDNYELTYLRKDGGRLPVMVSVTALRDARQIIIGYLFIGTDNTVRDRFRTVRKRSFSRA